MKSRKKFSDERITKHRAEEMSLEREREIHRRFRSLRRDKSQNKIEHRKD